MSSLGVLWDRHGEEATLAAVRSRHSPVAGTLVFAAQAAQRRDVWMFESVLRSLGKGFQPSELHRSQTDAFAYTAAWLAAEGVRRIVVTHAEGLHPRHLRVLTELTAVVGCDLIFFGQGPVDFKVGEALRNWTHLDSTDGGIEQLLPPVVEDAVDNSDGRLVLKSVPDSDFSRFRAGMRDLLSEDEFAVGDSIYRAAHTRALQNLTEPDEERAAMLLIQSFELTKSAAEQTIAIRALQAAALRNRLRVDVDHEGVLRARGINVGSDTLTAEQWGRLNASCRPLFSAIAALCLGGIDPEDMVRIRRRDVGFDGRYVDIDGACSSIPDKVRRAVVAQLLVHAAFGYDDDDPFLRDGARWTVVDIRRALNVLTRTTGIPLRVACSPARSTLSRWEYRSGVSISWAAA